LKSNKLFTGKEKNMVNVIGLGYIGLPTALMLASHGVEVVGTDYNQKVVDSLTAGKMTFKEDGIEELFHAALEAGISFTTEYQKTDTYIISVPTPYDKFSKKVDPVYVSAAVKSVLEVAPKGAIIVIESTISPGTIDKSVRPVVEEFGYEAGKDVHLVHAPERIIPGNMVYELLHNNRTIGADDKEVGERIKELYTAFCQGEIVVTDIRTAEMTKVVENTFRAVNIAFANELAKICRHDDMDVYEIIKICNMHPRVNILQPGPGVGGHCISVDPWFLVGDYPSLAKVIDESMRTNDGMPDFVLGRIYEIMRENGLKDISRVGLYGMTYKENVDDVRESPTLQLLESQARHLAAGLKVYDPFIEEDLVDNQYHSLEGFLSDVDMVVIMVKHAQIKDNMQKLAGKIVLDCQNIIDLPNVYHI
jgi:UDP-N-acetyl-D-mannosaminuronic acid dehydrogenase